MAGVTDAYDEALTRLAGSGAETTIGFSNHAPMVADALVRMDRADAVGPWLDRYAPYLLEGPTPGRPLDDERWHEALGHYRRLPEWEATFRRDLAEQPWPEVVTTWVPRLLPGVFAAATHGAIRTFHVARAVRDRASVGPAVSEELKSHGLRTDIYPAEDAFFMRPLISAMAAALGKNPPRAVAGN